MVEYELLLLKYLEMWSPVLMTQDLTFLLCNRVIDIDPFSLLRELVQDSR